MPGPGKSEEYASKPMSTNRAEVLAAIYQPIEEELSRVRRVFEDELGSDLPFLGELCRHVGRFRGKMVRPALVLLSGKACGNVTREHSIVAAVAELVHIATLVHDDVLDGGLVRRGLPSVTVLQGNQGAVLLGDFLISHAFHLCSSLDSQYASRLIGSTTNTVCEGELLQVHERGNFKLSEEQYFEIISRKTASLISTCCLLGAKFAGAKPGLMAAFEAFGLNLGIAFQIIDDVLDITGSEAEMGKTLGRDIEEGKVTLPVIHLIRDGAREDRDEALHILSNGYADRLPRIRELAVRNESVSYAMNTASRYTRMALENLAELPESDAQRALAQMARFVIQRRA